MKQPGQKLLSLITYNALLGTALVSFMLPVELPAAKAMMLPPSDVMVLTGVVRDFSSTHPDFGITNAADMGHFVGMVAPVLNAENRPVATGSGVQVAAQWQDQYGNPIVPYAGPGLPGGHFDVDVYDSPSVNELEHEHQFDDNNDVAFFDVVNHTLSGNPASLFANILGPVYMKGVGKPLRMVFGNVHNGGGGTFRFDAGAGLVEGVTADGFTAIFNPINLVELRVDFVALAALRDTNPNLSQADPVDRDDAFRIRMYDNNTNALVYEVTIYHHFKDKNGNGLSDDIENLVPPVTLDACGNTISDTAGLYGAPGTAAITDSTSFGQWFRDVLGTNQSTVHAISLQRDATGVYEYMTNAFFPIDGRLRGNEGEPNNNLFTYAISASFTYNTCTDQFFEFESNDDAWAFVDAKLVIDLGGTLTPVSQYVDLDRLGLVDGQTYTIDFFFAHRRVTLDSLFHMRTNIQLTSGTLPTILAFYD